MSANLYCWAPRLGLDPKARDFHDRIEALHEGPEPPPSPQLLAFVADLLARYPDLDHTAPDTVWAAGPLASEIIGEFINMAIVWSRYGEAARFVIETAHRHGLHCYDPQGEDFYPCPSAQADGAAAQRRKRAPDELPPITLERLGCTLAGLLILGMVAYGLWTIRDFLGPFWALLNSRGNW